MHTIAAVATPPGTGGIAVIRISGPDAVRIGGRLCPAFGRKSLTPLTMVYGTFYQNDQPIDKGYCVYMPTNRSYTGEKTVELHCHGGRQVTQTVLTAALEAGCRMAEPGEYTRRAFLNGRIQLSSAEAVMDFINARTDSAAKIALHQLEGRLDKEIRSMEDKLLDMIARAEVTVDYPEEDVEEAVSTELLSEMDTLLRRSDMLLAHAREGRLYQQGVRIVLTGLPNAGKSSLLNTLVGKEKAIVSSVPGTTRDVIEAEGELSGMPVTWVDTAGIRESLDEVERIGVERAQKALEQAHLVILLLDGDRTVREEDTRLYERIRDIPHLVAITKSDLTRITLPENLFSGETVYRISSQTGEGVEELQKAILQLLGKGELDPEDAVMSGARHIDAVMRAKAALERSKATLIVGFTPDLAVPDMREAWHALGEITGDTADEAVIDRIFAKFCVGK